ncbi:hypothetical protein D9M70_538880 [compost metagenome]
MSQHIEGGFITGEPDKLRSERVGEAAQRLRIIACRIDRDEQDLQILPGLAIQLLGDRREISHRRWADIRAVRESEEQ